MRKAQDAGKTVPPEVLADYPDLQKKAAPAPAGPPISETVAPATVPVQEPISAVERIKPVENGGRIAIILPDGRAVVGGVSHPTTWNAAVASGAFTDAELANGVGGYIKPDGTAWAISGKFLPNVTKVVIVSEELSKPKPAGGENAIQELRAGVVPEAPPPEGVPGMGKKVRALPREEAPGGAEPSGPQAKVGDVGPDVSGMTKQQLVTELLGEKPKPVGTINVQQRVQWDKDFKDLLKRTHEDLHRMVKDNRISAARESAISEATKTIQTEVQKVADEAGPKWRTALREKADAEGVRYPTAKNVDKGTAIYYVARAIAEKRRITEGGVTRGKEAQEMPEVKPQAPAQQPVPPSSSQALGIVPPGSAALQELVQRATDYLKSLRVTTTAGLRTSMTKPDVMAGRHWINSPEFLFRNDPVAAPFVAHLTEAHLRLGDRTGRDVVHFTTLVKMLKLDRRKRVEIMSALKQREAGNRAAFDNLPPEMRRFAEEVRTYWDEWKERIRARKSQAVLEELPEARRNAVEAILNGTAFEDAVRQFKLRQSGRAAVEMALREYQEAANWGIEDYVTHAEMGSWKVLDEQGNVIALAKTKAGAVRKMEEIARGRPDAQLSVDNEFTTSADWPSQLTPPAYWRLLSNMKKMTDASVRDMQRALRRTAPHIVIKPTNKYSRYLERRRGVLAGEEDIMDILPSYIYSMWKKWQLDPVLHEFRTQTGKKLSPTTREALETLIQDVKGRKYMSDAIVDHLFSGVADAVEAKTGIMLPIEPYAFSRGINTLRNISANLALGWRPVAVAMNRMGGIQHTWVKTGLEDLREGQRWIKTPEAQRILKENEAEMGLQATFSTEGRVEQRQKWWMPMGMFQMMEPFNRMEAFGAFYIKATKRLGMTREAAIDYANREVRSAQFAYNLASLPRLMRIPSGRATLQFKSYLLKELEFIRMLKGEEIPRYMASFLALGGPRAAMIMLRALPFLGAWGLLGELDDWLNRNFPRAHRGVAGFLGADISAAATPQLPSQPEDWIGVTLSSYYRLWRDIIAPALGGEDRDIKDVRDWLIRVSPSAMYWNQLVQGIADASGWTKNSRGQNVYKPTAYDMVKFPLGARPLQSSVEAAERRFLLEQERIQRSNRQHYLDRLASAELSGDSSTSERLIGMAEDYGFSNMKELGKAVRKNIENRALTPQERTWLRMSRFHRASEAKRFENTD